MNSRNFLVPLVLGYGVVAGVAHAQGTAQQRTACMGDVFKFCSSDIPSASAIEGCLRRNVSQLKPACQVVLQPESGGAASRLATRATPDNAPRRGDGLGGRTGGPQSAATGTLMSAASAPASPRGVSSCLRQAARLKAKVARYFTSSPAGAAQDMVGGAMAFMPMITSLANGGGVNLEGMNLGGMNLAGINIHNGDEILRAAMSLLSQAREAGSAGSAEGCRAAMAQVEEMIPRGRRR